MANAPSLAHDGKLEHLYSLSALDDAGFGNRATITKLINSGEVPARKVNIAFKIPESALPLLAVPVAAAYSPEAQRARSERIAVEFAHLDTNRQLDLLRRLRASLHAA